MASEVIEYLGPGVHCQMIPNGAMLKGCTYDRN
jgi:hypothetical protein